MARIIIGLISAAVGAVIVIKAEWIFQNFGRVPWAEKHLGTEGGSRLFYKLIGLVIIIIGFLTATNLIGGLILSVLSPIFKGLR